MTSAFLTGLHLYNLDRNEEAAREFRKHLAEQPGDATGHAYLSLCLSELDKVEEATYEAQQAITNDPTEDFGYYALGRAYLQRNRMKEARDALKEAIRLLPSKAAYYAFLGLIEMREQRWQAALEAADQGLACDPEDTTCLNLRANALTHLGRRAEAAQTIQDALSKDPDNDWSHANQGWAELHNGRPYPAMEHFREALRLNPENAHARAGIAEAMKARNFIYRFMLGFFLWMTRLPAQWRYGVIIAIFVAPGILKRFGEANPNLAIAAEVANQLILVFVVMTWIATPLFNLVLRFDRMGKYALSEEDIRGANLLAAFLFPALALWVASWFFADDQRRALTSMALCIGVIVLPASQLFACDKGWPRNTMLGYMLVMCGLAALGVSGWGVHGFVTQVREAPPVIALFTAVGILASLPLFYSPLVTFFLAQWLVKAEVRR